MKKQVRTFFIITRKFFYSCEEDFYICEEKTFLLLRAFIEKFFYICSENFFSIKCPRPMSQVAAFHTATVDCGKKYLDIFGQEYPSFIY